MRETANHVAVYIHKCMCERHSDISTTTHTPTPRMAKALTAKRCMGYKLELYVYDAIWLNGYTKQTRSKPQYDDVYRIICIYVYLFNFFLFS